MDCNLVECEMAERDGGECSGCGCEGGSLEVLKEVQRAYEDRLDKINRAGGPNKLEKQVHLLQCWVSDLVGQNALLARTVEQLEEEVTSRVLLERRRHAEMECEVRAEAATLRRQLERKDGDLRGLLEVLRRLRDPAHPRHCALANIHFNERDNTKKTCEKVKELVTLNESLHNQVEARDREIRRLNQTTEQYEKYILSLKKEMSLSNYHVPDVSKQDVGVTADICCPGLQVRDTVPEKDYTCLLRKETVRYQERLEQIEKKVQSSSERVRALREANVALAAETHTLQQVCAALAEQSRLSDMRAKFTEYLVREMRRQIIQAKAKLKSYEERCIKVSNDKESIHEGGHNACSNTSLSAGEPCARQQPRRALRRRPHPDLGPWDRGSAGADDEDSSRH